MQIEATFETIKFGTCYLIVRRPLNGTMPDTVMQTYDLVEAARVTSDANARAEDRRQIELPFAC